MDSYFILCFMVLSIWINLGVHAQPNNFRVTDFGAVGDGKRDNSQALMNAWSKACGVAGGVVTVPKGVFLVKGAEFKGPCVGKTVFGIDGTLLATNDPVLVEDYWITFYRVDDLTLAGNGLVDGNGAYSWSHCQDSNNCDKRPNSIKINHVSRSWIRDLNFVNSKFFHLVVHESSFMNLNNLHITAPADSPNTDGIHLGNSHDVKIMNSYIATGDDCISMGDGSKNINITGIWCGPGHGISIGSLGKYEQEENVSGITVRNCTFNQTDNGLRIKTWAPSTSSSLVSDVTFTDINMINGVENPIIVDQYYCPDGECQNNGESTVAIKGVRFIDIKGSAASETAVSLQCSKKIPCQDIVFSGLDLTYNGKPTAAVCSNADDMFRGSGQIPSRCS